MKNPRFWKFWWQLFHSSLAKIFENFKPGMTTPEIVRCCDNHFRKAIYGLGPYIADYPEQVLLTCIVQGWCPQRVLSILIFYIYLQLLPFQMYCKTNKPVWGGWVALVWTYRITSERVWVGNSVGWVWSCRRSCSMFSCFLFFLY